MEKPDISEVAAAIPQVRFIGELGTGGFKVAYRAEVNGILEAVKIVRIPVDPEDSAVEEANRKRLRRELALLGRCRTPCLVKLGQLEPFDCRISGREYVCYSEELLQGESMRARIDKKHRPPQAELAQAGSCLFAAVAELAGQQAIHRDIKPDNVFVTGDVKRPFVLLDLGLAFIVGGTNLTLDAQAIPGTRYYRAPEMLEQNFRQSLDYRADLYTIGLTLYEYAAGGNPFARAGDDQLDTLYRIKRSNPARLATLRPDIDASMCSLIDQLIKKLPALRPSNLQILIRQMEGYR